MNTMIPYCCKPLQRIGWLVSMLLIAGFAQAQLCQGSLGDPIVNITFGSGSNPGPPLPVVLGLQYQTADCPDDGHYTLRNSTGPCFNNTWHTLNNDHTGNSGGYFMLINASVQPSVFYLDTVRGLCGGTTYEFAAWVLNILKTTACNGSGSQPNLTFSIENTNGSILQTYNTNTIAPGSFPFWKQYGFFFATPASVSAVVLRITNNAPGGCGNDLALDDITFRPCGPQLTNTIVGQTTDTLNSCQGIAQTVQFTGATTTNSGSMALQWQQRYNGGSWTDISGATNATFSYSFSTMAAPGIYEFRIGAADAANIGSLLCRTYATPVSIVINSNPMVAIAASGIACAGKLFGLTATGGNQYNWMGPNSYSATGATQYFQAIQPSQAGNYTVVATSGAGCTATASFTVTVFPSPVAGVSFADTTICLGKNVGVSASGGSLYQWFPFAGLSATNLAAPLASPAITTRYGVAVSNASGCADTAFVNVNVAAAAIAHAGPDKDVIKGTPVLLEGSILGRYAQFYWQPAAGLSNPQDLQPAVTPLTDVAYWLTVVSLNNCGTSTDTVFIKVYKDIFIPGAFSPNGDGLNDDWKIPALQAYQHFELTIYNRYGQRVFEAKNQYQPWDGRASGTLLPAGTYVYYLYISDVQKSWKGTVILLR